MDYVVVVPSFRRAELFAAHTLAYLQSTNVPLDRVEVLLSDEQDVAAYQQAAPGVALVVPELPITNVRDKFNAIHYRYPRGTRVVVLEDDVRLITGVQNKATPLVDLDGFVHNAFGQIAYEGLWGIAPHSNSFYFSGKVTRTLKLTVAHAFGFVATQDPALAVTQPSKTDYERTCRYFSRYGEVVRMDMVGVKTNSYTQPGGMQAQSTREQRAAMEQESCEYLVQRWPHLIEHNRTKKSLFAELRFKRCSLTLTELLTLDAQGLGRCGC